MSEDHFTRDEADGLEDAIGKLLHLRANGFWSFRGQRNYEWSLGLHPARDYADEKKLQELFHQFRRRCMEFNSPPYVREEDDWRWMFYAQHHRLRTRLLDWTSDPLVAIYFAVEEILSHEPSDDVHGAVWALKVDESNFLSERTLHGYRKPTDWEDHHPGDDDRPPRLDRWVMINPAPITSRIRRQSAKFSYHPKGDDEVLNQAPRRPNESLVRVLLKRPASEIRRHLGIMNTHHAALFPDTDGVAAFVNAQWHALAPLMGAREA